MHPLDPIEFNQISYLFGSTSCRMCMDEVQNMKFNICKAVVAFRVEMFPDFTTRSVVTNIVEV